MKRNLLLFFENLSIRSFLLVLLSIAPFTTYGSDYLIDEEHVKNEFNVFDTRATQLKINNEQDNNVEADDCADFVVLNFATGTPVDSEGDGDGGSDDDGGDDDDGGGDDDDGGDDDGGDDAPRSNFSARQGDFETLAIVDGTIYTEEELFSNLYLHAEVSGEIGSLTFVVNNIDTGLVHETTVNSSPYVFDVGYEFVPASYRVDIIIYEDEFGTGSICSSQSVFFTILGENECDAVACTMTADSPLACIGNGDEFTIISATGNDDGNVPDGFSVVYALTFGNDLTIWDLNTEPTFEVAVSGDYRIHKFVYDPTTVNPYSAVEFYVTTVYDCINLIENIGACANIDVDGAWIWVDKPLAGTLTAVNPEVILDGGTAIVEATPNGDISIPAGYTAIYFLQEDDVILQASESPSFEVTEAGTYAIHTLVYDPEFLIDITSIYTLGTTTVTDLNEPFLSEEFCGDLDVEGGTIDVIDGACEAVACTMSPTNPLACIGNGDESTLVSATGNDDGFIPEGFESIYVLTFGNDLTIWDTNPDVPEFMVSVMGDYRIHKFVYDPNTLDINAIIPFETTGFDVLNLIESENLCADLDPEGAFFWVDKPLAGTLTAVATEVPLEDDSATIAAIPNGDMVIPAGYTAIYFLSEGDLQLVTGINSVPEFEVTIAQEYTIHTLVYDPEFLTDITSIYTLGTTTITDLNEPFLSEEFCGDLDVEGVPINVVQENCEADAGTLSALEDNVSLDDGSALLTAIPNGDINVPDGFLSTFILTQGESLIIQEIGEEPSFRVFEIGLFTIHTLVWNPETLDVATAVELGVTPAGDVAALLIQGGGSICASLDVPGALFNVEPESSLSVGIYPNPSQGNFFLNMSGIPNEMVTVTVYNLNGAMVHQKALLSSDITNASIDLNNLNDGVYFVNIVTTDLNHTKRIILKR